MRYRIKCIYSLEKTKYIVQSRSFFNPFYSDVFINYGKNSPLEQAMYHDLDIAKSWIRYLKKIKKPKKVIDYIYYQGESE